MSKIILIDGKLTREKLEQLLRRYAPRERKPTKATLGDVWPGKKEVRYDETRS